MKKLVLVVLLLSAFSFAANKPANPADYNVNVHVSATSVQFSTDGVGHPFLNVVIAGKNYQLLSEQGEAGHKATTILPLGDYKAKLVTDEHDTVYRSIQSYEFLFPDGKTAKFDVVGTSE
jgi:hypothetical protein